MHHLENPGSVSVPSSRAGDPRGDADVCHALVRCNIHSGLNYWNREPASDAGEAPNWMKLPDQALNLTLYYPA